MPHFELFYEKDRLIQNIVPAVYQIGTGKNDMTRGVNVIQLNLSDGKV